MAREYGIKIYTIGIGSDKEISEVVQSPLGSVTQTRKLEYNENLLKDIAQITGGQYFQATDNKALEKIYASINQLEKNKVQLKTYDHYTNKFLPFLLASM